MDSHCPCCSSATIGYDIKTSERSYTRSFLKLCYSILVPLPFVGSFIGNKIKDIIDFGLYQRFICPNCGCVWIEGGNDSKLKLCGNDKIGAYFYDDRFAMGSIKSDFYIVGHKSVKSVYAEVYWIDSNVHKCRKHDIDTPNIHSSFCFMRHNTSSYIGEITNGLPDGFGMEFRRDGSLWYGQWKQGAKNGVGFESDTLGKGYNVGYWNNNVQII